MASAKAHFSTVLSQAEHAPQVVERRGKPVAVVVGAGQFSGIGEIGSGSLFEARWKRFLDFSAGVRAEGGAELKIPRRRVRPSPFSRKTK